MRKCVRIFSANGNNSDLLHFGLLIDEPIMRLINSQQAKYTKLWPVKCAHFKLRNIIAAVLLLDTMKMVAAHLLAPMEFVPFHCF